MFTISALIPDLFATGLSNHQIIVDRPSGLRPVSCIIGNGVLALAYRTSLNTTVRDQWDTGISVDSLSDDAVLRIAITVDGAAQVVTNIPATVTLRKSGGGGNTRAKSAKGKGKVVGSFQSSKSNLMLIRYNR